METVAPALLDACIAEAEAREYPRLRYDAAVASDQLLCAMLEARGFRCVHRVRRFQVDVSEGRARIQRMHERAAQRIPAQWRCVPLGWHRPEEIQPLVERFALMDATEFWRHWHSPGDRFDPRTSVLLFDGEELIGAMLVRRVPGAFLVEVRAVAMENPRLRALANLALLHASSKDTRNSEDPRICIFRAGELEHRETANLALRMGGREMPAQCAMERTFT
jgi:hypothetical protein